MVRLSDGLALARRAQVTEWVEHEDLTIEDAHAELGSPEKAVGMIVGGTALALGGNTIDVRTIRIDLVGSGWKKVVGTRSDGILWDGAVIVRPRSRTARAGAARQRPRPL